MSVKPEVLRKVLKHSLVSYITVIPIQKIIITEHSLSLYNPQLHMLLTQEKLELFLSKWRINFGNIQINWKEEIPVASLNFEVVDMKYRYLQISAFGNVKPGFFNLFTVPRNDYYQDKIYFTLYDLEGKLILTNHMVFDLNQLPKKNN